MRVMIALSDKQTKQRILDSLGNVTIVIPESISSAVNETTYHTFDFVIAEYPGDIDGRKIYEPIFKQNCHLETYVMMLVYDKDEARKHLIEFLKTPYIGKNIEFMRLNDLDRIPERIQEFGDPWKRRKQAENGIPMIPYDKRTVMTFRLESFPASDNTQYSHESLAWIQHDIDISANIEMWVSDYHGNINFEKFTVDPPVQAVFNHVKDAISALIHIRSELRLNGCVIVEGPITEIDDKIRRPVLHGNIFKQSSRLLEISIEKKATFVALKPGSQINKEIDKCDFERWKDLEDEFDGCEIYELKLKDVKC
jgi:hypothetical protein